VHPVRTVSTPAPESFLDYVQHVYRNVTAADSSVSCVRLDKCSGAQMPMILVPKCVNIHSIDFQYDHVFQGHVNAFQ